MVRPPRSFEGTLRSSNDLWTIDLEPSRDLASLSPDTPVQVLVWDAAMHGLVEQVAHTQQVTVEDAAEGLGSRGALYVGTGAAGSDVSAPFHSRLEFNG
jgi:hypothetical protein